MWHRSVKLSLAALAGCVGLAIPALATASESNPWTIQATRACTLVMSSDAAMEQWKRCIEAVGDVRPSDSALLSCASTVKWHSQTDGNTAGLKIRECFRKAG
jgi:hypothetical protein